MIDSKLNFNITQGVLRVQLSNNKYDLLNAYLSGIHNRDTIGMMIKELKELQTSPEKFIKKHGGWSEYPAIGRVATIGGNETTSRLYKDGQIGFIDTSNPENAPLYYPANDLIDLYEKIAEYFASFEKEESFKTYPDLIATIHENHRDWLLSLGFSLVRQSPVHVRFTKTDLSLEFVDNREGIGLYFIDEVSKNFYEFGLAFESLDWNAARLHFLRCHKYKTKFDIGKRRTGIINSIFRGLKSHFVQLLSDTQNTSFLQRLEAESQLQREMLERVFSLPKDDPIRQLFASGNLQWMDMLREEIPTESAISEPDSEIAQPDAQPNPSKEPDQEPSTIITEITWSELLKVVPEETEDCDNIHQKYLAWHKLEPADEKRLILLGKLVPDAQDETYSVKSYPSLENYWSEDAPIVLAYYPYIDCEVFRLKSCSSLYLVYTEYTGHAPEKRCRLVRKRLIDKNFS